MLTCTCPEGVPGDERTPANVATVMRPLSPVGSRMNASILVSKELCCIGTKLNPAVIHFQQEC